MKKILNNAPPLTYYDEPILIVLDGPTNPLLKFSLLYGLLGHPDPLLTQGALFIEALTTLRSIPYSDVECDETIVEQENDCMFLFVTSSPSSFSTSSRKTSSSTALHFRECT